MALPSFARNVARCEDAGDPAFSCNGCDRENLCWACLDGEPESGGGDDGDYHDDGDDGGGDGSRDEFADLDSCERAGIIAAIVDAVKQNGGVNAVGLREALLDELEIPERMLDDAMRAARSQHVGQPLWARGPHSDNVQCPPPSGAVSLYLPNVQALSDHDGTVRPADGDDQELHYATVRLEKNGFIALECEDRSVKGKERDMLKQDKHLYLSISTDVSAEDVLRAITRLQDGNKPLQPSKFKQTRLRRGYHYFTFKPARLAAGGLHEPMSQAVGARMVVINNKHGMLKWSVRKAAEEPALAIWATSKDWSTIPSAANVAKAVLEALIQAGAEHRRRGVSQQLCQREATFAFYDELFEVGLTFTEGAFDARVTVTTSSGDPDFVYFLRSVLGGVSAAPVHGDTFAPDGLGSEIGKMLHLRHDVGGFDMFFDDGGVYDEMKSKFVRQNCIHTLLLKPQRKRLSTGGYARRKNNWFSAEGRSPYRLDALRLTLAAQAPLLYVDPRIANKSLKGGTKTGAPSVIELASTRSGVHGFNKVDANGDLCLDIHGEIEFRGGLIEHIDNVGQALMMGDDIATYTLTSVDGKDKYLRKECPEHMARAAYMGDGLDHFMTTGARVTPETEAMIATRTAMTCQKSDKADGNNSWFLLNVTCSKCMIKGHTFSDCWWHPTCGRYHPKTTSAFNKCASEMREKAKAAGQAAKKDRAEAERKARAQRRLRIAAARRAATPQSARWSSGTAPPADFGGVRLPRAQWPILGSSASPQSLTVDSRFSGLETRISQIEGRVTSVDGKLSKIMGHLQITSGAGGHGDSSVRVTVNMDGGNALRPSGGSAGRSARGRGGGGSGRGGRALAGRGGRGGRGPPPASDGGPPPQQPAHQAQLTRPAPARQPTSPSQVTYVDLPPKIDFEVFDLHVRTAAWSLPLEGPPQSFNSWLLAEDENHAAEVAFLRVFWVMAGQTCYDIAAAQELKGVQLFDGDNPMTQAMLASAGAPRFLPKASSACDEMLEAARCVLLKFAAQLGSQTIRSDDSSGMLARLLQPEDIFNNTGENLQLLRNFALRVNVAFGLTKCMRAYNEERALLHGSRALPCHSVTLSDAKQRGAVAPASQLVVWEPPAQKGVRPEVSDRMPTGTVLAMFPSAVLEANIRCMVVLAMPDGYRRVVPLDCCIAPSYRKLRLASMRSKAFGRLTLGAGGRRRSRTSSSKKSSKRSFR